MHTVDAREERAEEAFKPKWSAAGLILAVLGLAVLNSAIAFVDGLLQQNSWSRHQLPVVQGATLADIILAIVTAGLVALIGLIGLGSLVRLIQVSAVKLAVVVDPTNKIPAVRYYDSYQMIRRDRRENAARASFGYNYGLYYLAVLLGVAATQGHGHWSSWILAVLAVGTGTVQAINYLCFACFRVLAILDPHTM